MRRRTLPWVTLCGSLLAACGSSSNTSFAPMDAASDLGAAEAAVDASLDADALADRAQPVDTHLEDPDVNDPPGGATLVYALTSVQFDADQTPPGSRAMHGFNLDGRYSSSRRADMTYDDCNHGDFFSALDPDQNMGPCTAGTSGGGAGCGGGVDNQLPALLTTIASLGTGADVGMALNSSIANGALAIVLRIDDVDGEVGPTLDDPYVTVNLYPVAHPNFRDCAMLGTPGLEYAIDNRSLTTPGDLDAPRVQLIGRITHGRLRVQQPRAAAAMGLPFPLTFAGAKVSLTVFQPRLGVDLTADGGEAGNLGGFARFADIVTTIAGLGSLPIDEAAARTLLQGFVDVATPLGATEPSCEFPEGGISLGFGLRAARATIAATPVNAGAPGTCGN